MTSVPRNFKAWPAADDTGSFDCDDVIKMYNDGFAGALEDRTNKAIMRQRSKGFGAITPLVGTGKGKLSLPFLFAEKIAPGCFPGPSQTTGDCVSRGTANAITITMMTEIALNITDEQTGKTEEFPGVPDNKQGIVATEPIYGCRGHRGQGASCSGLAKAVSDYGGVMLRGKHDIPGFGELDLSRYDSSKGHNWGPRTPDSILKYAAIHKIRAATYIDTIEQACDALANGYGVNCCSGYGFSSQRDTNGIARRQGSWSHAMAWTACDDSEEAKALGGPLFLVQNSWGKFNDGPKRHGQPDGSFWITARNAAAMLSEGDSYTFSSFAGFPKRDLPDFGGTTVL